MICTFFLNLEAWSSSNVGRTGLHFIYLVASNRQRLTREILALFLPMGKWICRDVNRFTKKACSDDCLLDSLVFKTATVRLCWLCFGQSEICGVLRFSHFIHIYLWGWLSGNEMIPSLICISDVCGIDVTLAYLIKTLPLQPDRGFVRGHHTHFCTSFLIHVLMVTWDHRMLRSWATFPCLVNQEIVKDVSRDTFIPNLDEAWVFNDKWMDMNEKEVKILITWTDIEGNL